MNRSGRGNDWETGRSALSLIVALCIALASACNHRDPAPPPPTVGDGFVEQWSLSLTDMLPLSVLPHETNPEILYVAAKGGGLLVLESDPTSAERGSSVESSALGGLDAMNLAQSGDLLVVSLGDFFAQAAKAGVATIDISDPRAPRLLGTWISDHAQHGAPDLVIDGDTVYLALMDHGVVSIDVSDPSTPTPIGSVLPDPEYPRANPGAIARPNARGLAVEGSLLYVANDAGGLRVVDIADPTKLVEVARYINPGTQKQQAYNDVLIDGDLAFVSLDYCGFEVIDITDPSDMRQVAWLDPWDCTAPSNLWLNSPGHTNELHLDPVRGTVWMSAGGSELLAVDISDPARPSIAATFGEPGNDRGTYGMGATGDRAYLAYIITIVPFQGRWSGIVAVDASF